MNVQTLDDEHLDSQIQRYNIISTTEQNYVTKTKTKIITIRFMRTRIFKLKENKN